MKINLETTFCLFLGKRKTKKQKKRFLFKVIDFLKDTKYQYEFSKAKTIVSSSVNLYFGNIKKASIILCAYYDTPSKKYFYSNYYPFDGVKTNKFDIKENVLSLLMFYGFVLIYLYLVLFDFISFPFYSLPFKLLSIVLSIIVLSKASVGFENPLNFNRNNSSVIALIEWATENYNSDVAIAFIDNGTSDKLGAQLLSKDIEGNDPIILMVDCVGQGCDLNIAITKNIKKILGGVVAKSYELEKKLSKYSNHFHFNKVAVISAGDVIGNDIVVKNTGTKKDVVIDQSLIGLVKSMITRIVDGI